MKSLAERIKDRMHNPQLQENFGKAVSRKIDKEGKEVKSDKKK